MFAVISFTSPNVIPNKENARQSIEQINSIEVGWKTRSRIGLNLKERKKKSTAITKKKIKPSTRKTKPEFFLSVSTVM